MYNYLKTFAALKLDTRAVTALEYALIAGGIGAVIAGTFSSFGTGISNLLANAATSISLK